MADEERRKRWEVSLKGFLAEERGHALQRLGRHREAAEQYEVALSSPTTVQGVKEERKLLLAESLLQSNRMDRARELLRDYLENDLPHVTPIEAREQREAQVRAWLKRL